MEVGAIRKHFKIGHFSRLTVANRLTDHRTRRLPEMAALPCVLSVAIGRFLLIATFHDQPRLYESRLVETLEK